MKTRIVIAASVALIAALLPAAERGGLERGKQIYDTCESPSRTPIIAILGEGGREMPAGFLPCVNCHGEDGRGKPEGGVIPSDVTWGELTKPYRTATAAGRRRPPYDDKSLARSITDGVDAAGNRLSSAMPRYRMSDADLNALIVYMKTLGFNQEQGVTETSIQIGTIVPKTSLGEEMVAVLSAVLRDAGEIHGRRVQLRAIELTPGIEQAIVSDPPFALVGGILVGMERHIEELSETSEIPLILPVTWNGDSSESNRQRFYLFASVAEQVMDLIRFSSEQRGEPITRLAIVARSSSAEVAASVERACRALSPPVETLLVDSVALATSNLTKGSAILLLDPTVRLAEVPAATSESLRNPMLTVFPFAPSDLLSAPAALREKILISFPAGPDDFTPAGVAALSDLMRRHGIPRRHLATQIAAYAAGKVFVEALKVAGRDLRRDTLRAALEALEPVQTGLTPPITFARNRRVAASAVYIARVSADGDVVPLSAPRSRQ